MRHRNTGIFALVLLVTGSVTAQTSMPTTYTQVQSSGIVGITGGQTARLNVLNLGTTPQAGVTASCSALVTFMDDQGTVLKTGTVTPDPGKSMLVDYPSTATIRQQIRVTIGIAHPAVMVPAPGAVLLPIFYCSLVPTLEIFDNSNSQTVLLVSDFHSVFAYPVPLTGVSTGATPMR